MFSEERFQQWLKRLNFTEAAINIIKMVRTSEPSRLVQSGRGNVSGRYSSSKMGVTIQFESHKNELAYIYRVEHDNDVEEYYDQPAAVKLEYESANGRHLAPLHTPDFFEIRKDCAGWVECKTEEELLRLEEHNPNRYCRDEEGQWRCPPGEAYAEQFGLFYRVESSKNISWTFHRNIEFLDDYLRSKAPEIPPTAHEAIISEVSAEPSLTLEELFKRTDGKASRDDIYMMIAHDEVYVDLYAVPLVDFDYVRVFPDRDTAIAYANIVQIPSSIGTPTPKFIDLKADSAIQWNGNGWKIVNVGETLVGLLGEGNAFTELPITAFEKLVQDGRITGVTIERSSGMNPEAKRRFSKATKEDYAEANYRMAIVRAHQSGDPLIIYPPISERTQRRWTEKYLQGEQLYGCGYVALLPLPNNGNSSSKLPSETRNLLEDFIENDYETLKQKKKFAVYAVYLSKCKELGIAQASYKTFCKAVRRRSKYLQTRKRQGHRSAYQYKEFYWELEPTTPRHGERPFHIVHIDHTETDNELICSLTGQNLGRAWTTFMTDAFCRRILAKYTTFDPPSYRSCMMVIRECVRRYGRMPQIVVVDGALEFSGVYFETLLARYDAIKKTRPPAEGRFGSVGERPFGTANTQYFHNLQGNTQIMRNVRQVTQSVNPKGLALWTLEAFDRKLGEWAYEVYDTIDHPALGQSPRDAFAAGMYLYGNRAHRLISYDEDFRMLTRPTTRKGSAKVHPGRGVKINYIHYWSEAFRNPEVELSQPPVRFEPWNAGIAYAFVKGAWVECHSEYYNIFRNRSEREMMLATAELRRRNTKHSQGFNITALKIAKFLESLEAEEVLLRQRMADRELRGIWGDLQDGQNMSDHLSSRNSNQHGEPERATGQQEGSGTAQKTQVGTANSLQNVVKLEEYGRF